VTFQLRHRIRKRPPLNVLAVWACRLYTSQNQTTADGPVDPSCGFFERKRFDAQAEDVSDLAEIHVANLIDVGRA